MTPMTLTKRILAPVALLGLAACGHDVGDDHGGDRGTRRGALTACYTTATALVCREQEVETEHGQAFVKLEDEVRALYPSACLDRDGDGDGTPDFLDDGAIGAAGGRSGGVDDAGAGSGGSGGASTDDGLDASTRCRRCERGPGEPGDLRFEVRDGQARLQRGTVLAVEPGGVTVATTSGPLLVLVDNAALATGAPTPGAEVRAEGALEPGAAAAMRATRFDVLCPGPAALDGGTVPPDALPVPGASGDDDGTPDQGSGDR